MKLNSEVLDREEILKQYLQWVEDVSDALENKTHFTPQEIVYKVCEIIEKEIGIFVSVQKYPSEMS